MTASVICKCANKNKEEKGEMRRRGKTLADLRVLIRYKLKKCALEKIL